MSIEGIAKSLPLHYALDTAEKAVAAVHKGEIGQELLNTVMTGLQQRMGLSMSEFLATDVGKIFLRPAPTDLHTRIELRKAQTRNEVEEPWDKSKSPSVRMDDNGDRDRDGNAADKALKMLATAVMSGKVKLAGLSADTRFGSLEQAIAAVATETKEGRELLEHSKQASLKRYYE
jgi:hypothetical protein